MTNLNIAHIVTPYFGPLNRGGTARVVNDLICKQADKGHKVIVMGGPSTRMEKTKVISFVNPIHKTKNWLLNWLYERRNGCVHTYKSLRRLPKEVDIIHNHLSEEGIGLSFLRKTPHLNTLHGTAYNYEDGLRFLATKLFSLTRNTKLVTVSKSAFIQHKRMYGSDLIGYVHNGIEPARSPFVVEPAKLNDIELCFAGRADPRKGLHIAIEVVDKLRQMKYDVCLKTTLLYDIRYPSYFRKMLLEMKNRPYVKCFIQLPYSKVHGVIGNSDALLFPILWEEPFGIVQLEAMACGTPVITFPKGPTTEIVQNGINGFLCSDVNQMCDAVLEINKINRHTCRESVLKNFSANVMCENYLKVYEKVIENA